MTVMNLFRDLNTRSPPPIR